MSMAKSKKMEPREKMMILCVRLLLKVLEALLSYLMIW